MLPLRGLPVSTKGFLNRLEENDAACLAGLIDGEGPVMLTRRHRNGNRQPCGSISRTELTASLLPRATIADPHHGVAGLPAR
jgi:hypothetical protein